MFSLLDVKTDSLTFVMKSSVCSLKEREKKKRFPLQMKLVANTLKLLSGLVIWNKILSIFLLFRSLLLKCLRASFEKIMQNPPI